MKAALTQQPLSVIIQANQRTFQTYSTGVLSSGCGTDLDHAVLAVGYGTENGQEYWLIKNSWNTWWGEEGYMRLKMQDGAGICGINMAASFAAVSK